MKKVLARIGTLLLVMAMTLAIIPGAAFAEAAASNNTINLTKAQGTSSQIGNDSTVDGTEKTVTDPISGVEFTLYKWNKTIADYKGVGSESGQLPTPTADMSVPEGFTAVTSTEVQPNPGTTGANGNITWTNLDDGIYFVMETNQKSTIATKSVPFYVILPFTNPTTGVATDTVYVYPKNVIKTPSLIIAKQSSENTATDSKTKYEVAGNDTTVKWTASVTLPETTANATQLKIVDTQNAAFGTPSDPVVTLPVTGTLPAITLTAGADNDYTYSYNSTKNAWTIEFTSTGLTKVKEYYAVNKDVTVNVAYNSKLTSPAAGTVYENKIQAWYTDEETTEFVASNEDVANVICGKITVIKKDESGNALNGVTFSLLKGGVEVATGKTENGNPVVFDGLDDGDYVVVEKSTAAGYAINKTEQAVTIGTPVTALTDAQKTVTMSNYKQAFLPLTGGTGITMIVIAGIALIGGAVVLMKKRNIAK